MMLPKQTPVHSQALRKSAKGRQCSTRIPSVCNFDDTTTVLAHPPLGNGGMSTKGSDDNGAFTCSNCHDCIDNRKRYAHIPRELVYECWIRGSQETRAIWREMGLLKIKGEKAA